MAIDGNVIVIGEPNGYSSSSIGIDNTDGGTDVSSWSSCGNSMQSGVAYVFKIWQ